MEEIWADVGKDNEIIIEFTLKEAAFKFALSSHNFMCNEFNMQMYFRHFYPLKTKSIMFSVLTPTSVLFLVS